MTETAYIEAGYEKITATCPKCGARNVYNRATDIGHFRPISNWPVVCENSQCHAVFDVIGDLINPSYEMLLLDACDLLREKSYTEAVLKATTAYEMFFSHYLRVEFVYRASTRDRTSDRDSVDWMTSATQLLRNATERHTFKPMRWVFLRAAVDNPHPATIAAAEAYIRSIPRRPAEVPRSDIEALQDQNLRSLLLHVLDSSIDDLRNDIVHKTAYRPTLDETKAAVDDAYITIFRLGQHYGLGNDNFHLNESPQDV